MNNSNWQHASEKAFDQQLYRNLQQLRDKHPIHWQHLFEHLDMLSELCPHLNTVVDVGCGIGVYYQLLQTHRSHLVYYGIDYASSAIKIAKETWAASSGRFIEWDIFHSVPPGIHLDASIVVANALLDVLPNGDEGLDTLLSYSPAALILQRVRVTEKPSYNIPYQVYGEIDTFEFYHNKENLFKQLADYTIHFQHFDPQTLDILAFK
jgi:trans-aconitate methyltransferase